MKSMKKVMITGLLGVMMSISVNVQAASCAGGAGIEIKGNDHGTYCRSAIGMNWWSAHAWCDAIGMKLVPMEECNCNDESKCDMTKQCPNFQVSMSGEVWTATPHGNSASYRFSLYGNGLGGYSRTESNSFSALCY